MAAEGLITAETLHFSMLSPFVYHKLRSSSCFAFDKLKALSCLGRICSLAQLLWGFHRLLLHENPVGQTWHYAEVKVTFKVPYSNILATLYNGNFLKHPTRFQHFYILRGLVLLDDINLNGTEDLFRLRTRGSIN